VNDFVQVVTVSDGLVTEVRKYYRDPAAVDACLDLPKTAKSA
jgi:hypothetical protein